ncbi:HNH endonuclease [Burkholderia multivorans]|uniref:HNH endonuclease n=1 Tax=Burkholderia multivorans TaxID=87883 RepID=UPI001B98FD4C|nr:HNH endonuclease [Burkholderia multivorans]MBR8124734.1 HNH endonuclease [Burkholderia multivorans]
MKTCKRCGIEKDESLFRREKRNKDGLDGTCRACTNARSVAWNEQNREKRKAHYEKNRTRLLEEKSAYYIKNSESIKRKRVAHRLENAERLREYQRHYSSENSEQIVERVRLWRSMNPGRKLVHNQNRRARKKRNGGELSADIVNRLMSLQRGKCACCHCQLNESGRHLDHIMPLILGGENSDRNVQLLCPTCNTQKHASHPVDFMRRKGFLV